MPLSKADHELLLGYLDRQLAIEATVTLESRLKQEPDLAQWLIRLAQDEAVITEWASKHRPTIAPNLEITQPRRAWLPVIIGITTVFLIGIVGWWTTRPVEREPQPIPEVPAFAHLEEVHGEAFIIGEHGEQIPVIAGQELKPGVQLHTSEGGIAIVRMPFIGRIELGTDTTVRLLPPEAQARMHIEKGTVYANTDSQPEQQPMMFTTPHAMIRASGNTVITSGMGDTSTVEMGSGSAIVTNTRDGQTVDVVAGNFTVANSKERKKQTVNNLPPRNNTPREVWKYDAGPTLAGMMRPGGTTYAFTTWDSRLVLRNTTTGEVLADLNDQKAAMHALNFSADGKLLVTGSHDKTAKIRDAATGRELIVLQKQKLEIHSIAASPDSTIVATGSGRIQGIADLKIWDAKTGTQLRQLRGPTGTIDDLNFSPDGRYLASASRDGGVRLWNTTTWESTGDITSHPQGALCVAFTPDSKTVVTGGRDGYIRIWDIENQKLARELEPPPQEIACVVVSPDGRFLAAGVGGSIWLWNLSTGLPIQTFAGHRYKVTSLSFSQDGKTIFSTGWDRTVKVWDVLAQ